MTKDISKPQRIVALTGSGAPITKAYAQLVEALRKGGAQVTPLPVPKRAPSSEPLGPPVISDLKAGIQSFAESLVSTLAGEDQTQAPWLTSHLSTAQRHADAVVALDPKVAARVFPVVDSVWPKAVRIAIDGDFHVAPAWNTMPIDDLVVPHPTLGADFQGVQRGYTRLRTAGPMTADTGVEAKSLSSDKPTVVVSFSRMQVGDVDPLLFQISLSQPDTFNLLFLPSGRHGVDELVRTRAGGYGLKGKRPKAGTDPEKWIRGASILIGHPAPAEAAIAVQASVPMLLFNTSALDQGDRFLVQHGAVLHAEQPITIAVQLESILPHGAARDKAVSSLSALAGAGIDSVAEQVLQAASEGRPEVSPVTPSTHPSDEDDELEDIGGPTSTVAQPNYGTISMPDEVRRAYLSEIILQQKQIEKQLLRAKAGLETWSHRERLAQSAQRPDLTIEAKHRVEGLKRVITRLENQTAQLQGLRDRFAGRENLTADDRQRASQFMSPEVARLLDRQARNDTSVFTQLEINDALEQLKNKLRGI